MLIVLYATLSDPLGLAKCYVRTSFFVVCPPLADPGPMFLDRCPLCNILYTMCGERGSESEGRPPGEGGF
jgi:hypothetical protein